VLDRATGRVERRISTRPFPGDTREAPGPEGLAFVQRNGAERLLLSDDDGRRLWELSLDEATFGQAVGETLTEQVGPVEGIEPVGDRFILASEVFSLLAVSQFSLKPIGPPFRPVFEGFGQHIAGVGLDAAANRLFATLSGYRANVNIRNHQGAFFELDRELQEIRALWHLGPFSNDPRGIAVADGLIYLVDGRSDFVDRDTKEENRGGIKCFVFLLRNDPELVAHALPFLPVRR